jgi:hypothetical protein
MRLMLTHCDGHCDRHCDTLHAMGACDGVMLWSHAMGSCHECLLRVAFYDRLLWRHAMEACFGGLHPGHIFISTFAPGTFHVRALLIYGFFSYGFFICGNLSNDNIAS